MIYNVHIFSLSKEPVAHLIYWHLKLLEQNQPMLSNANVNDRTKISPDIALKDYEGIYPVACIWMVP